MMATFVSSISITRRRVAVQSLPWLRPSRLKSSLHPNPPSSPHSSVLIPLCTAAPPRKIASDLTTATVDASQLSPMMCNYVATKRHLAATLGPPPPRPAVLLYRVGDFFESFFEDARLLASVCDLTLTSKEAGKALGARVPMAGVPHHAVDPKIRMLLAAGVTVAVVDQMQTAAQRPQGGLVRRAVTRLITPGTASDDALLDARRSSYVAAVAVGGRGGGGLRFGFAYADVSTGEFCGTEGEGVDALQRVLANVTPAEVLVVGGRGRMEGCAVVEEEVRKVGVTVVTMREVLGQEHANRILREVCGVDDVESLGCRGRALCVEAAASLALFTQETLAIGSEQERPLPLARFKTFSMSEVMMLDAACLRNMEVVETVREGGKERTLQWAVDRTMTGMGARCLRSWLLAPSMSLDVIAARQGVVEALLYDDQNVRLDIQRELRSIADLERLGGRVGAGRATPRELRTLAESILQLPAISELVKKCFSAQSTPPIARESDVVFVAGIDADLVCLAKEIDSVLVDPAPAVLMSELFIRGGSVSKENWNVSSTQIFRQGYNETLDGLKRAIHEPSKWITDLEARERDRTGIENLKIKHIKNTGYVLRIPRAAGEKIMDGDPMYFVKLGYERVQSTKAELRFRFDELRTHEKDHNAAFSEVVLLELRLFNQLRRTLAEHVSHLRALANQLAALDVLAGFAQLAEEHRYVKPMMVPSEQRILELCDARHPIVEQALAVGNAYIPNSFKLGAGGSRTYPDLMILCGPNAAGKSCALRSIGLISILAQIGCFVPAVSAKLSLCDRIFTRVGAVDDLARGQSTFQVEMAETACILSHATSKSLVLLDEIGRGTSTVDGIAIAWSVSEHLATQGLWEGSTSKPPRTIFVTHYHELNQLATLHDNIQSFQLHVEEHERVSVDGERQLEWITTHKVIPGASYHSFGLDIARRAGFPDNVMKRADEISSFLHEPSKLLGAKLRKALSFAQYPEDYPDSSDTKPHLMRHDVPHREGSQDQEYQCGFEDGYAKARAEFCHDLKQQLVNLESKYGKSA